jgi:ribonuclease Z
MSHIVYQRKIDSNKIKLVNTPFCVIGESVAARYTTIYISGLNIMFDCGHTITEKNPSLVFISHVHLDHVRGLTSLILDTTKKYCPLIFVPIASKELLKIFLTSAIDMTKHSDKVKPAKLNIIGVRFTGDAPYFLSFEHMMINKKEYKIELFKCTHTIPTTGYGIIELRNKLCDEYVGLSQKELEDIKKESINITKQIELPLFCFLGDTTHHVLFNGDKYNSHIEKYYNIIIECTYLDDLDIDLSHINKHIHWQNIKKYILDHPEINFILYHFSMKYDYEFIKTFFEKENIKNVNPLIHEF